MDGNQKRRPHPSKEEKRTLLSFKQFVHQPQDTYSLSNNSVYSIIQDSHDNIWIACYGVGLNLLSHVPDGSTNFIHSGNLADSSGECYYISVFSTVSKYLLTEDIQFKSYTIKDGLASD